ncbi:hypothetical protein ACIRPK_22755 [Kitasatospora sp. NPDC101801]|uniref:hypothetical protein n=1 Tax=Kitasatospora sp. NPDC101801 TaxID=3364103 RepID=UPI0038027040
MAQRRRARRLGTGSLTDRVRALLAAPDPAPADVLAVLADHPDADRLFSTDACLWLDDTEPYEAPRPDDAVYSRYRLLLLEITRAHEVRDWAAGLAPAFRLYADDWAQALPPLQDEEGRTYESGPWHWD